jgi:hypothetical protein
MIRLAIITWLISAATLFAQQPIIPASVPAIPTQGPSPIVGQSLPRSIPAGSTQPGELPPSILVPPKSNTPAAPLEKLPREEGRFKIDVNSFQVRRLAESTQLYHAAGVFRDFGKFDREAEDVVRYLRTSRPTEWATIGSPRPIVEYGLRDGEPTKWNPTPRWSTPIDFPSVRSQNVRGAWVVRDDANILLNFGLQREEAEQATAVIRRYGFNRIGMIGYPTAVFTYFYLTSEVADKKTGIDANAMLNAAAQEQMLQRTGLAIPGAGFVGEKLSFDPRKVEVRKERGEFVLAHGTDTIGKFGVNDWVARDALRLIQDCRFTEYCTFGGAGVSFFLVNGRAPTRVPFFAQGLRFEAKSLKVRTAEAGKWGLFEPSGRMIFTAVSQLEGEQLLKVIQYFQFDTLCTVGGTASNPGLRFLASLGGR